MDFIYNMYLLNMKPNTHYICLIAKHWLTFMTVTFPPCVNCVIIMKLFTWFHVICHVTFVELCERFSTCCLCVRACMCLSLVWGAQMWCLCKYRRGLCLQVLYVPDPEYVSSVGSSPSLSPISPLSPTSSEADLEKVTVCRPHLWRTISHARNIFLYG